MTKILGSDCFIIAISGCEVPVGLTGSLTGLDLRGGVGGGGLAGGVRFGVPSLLYLPDTGLDLGFG